MLFAFKTLKEKFTQMKQQKTKKQSFQELEIEKNKLYVTKQNPTRLKEIIKKLDYFYYGLK